MMMDDTIKTCSDHKRTSYGFYPALNLCSSKGCCSGGGGGGESSSPNPGASKAAADGLLPSKLFLLDDGGKGDGLRETFRLLLVGDGV